MQISTILDYIDNGHMALPEFQRGYVWSRDQVRGLFGSLYRRHPVGGLLVWATQSEEAIHRGDQQLAPGVVKLLLDGQQRMTSLYGVIRGAAPQFFDGNEQAFTGLHFHIGNEEFQFYQPIAMRDDPLWIDVSKLFANGNEGLGKLVAEIATRPEHAALVGEYAGRLNRLLGIRDIGLHIEEITGPDMTLDVVVDIFNKVNSGGTKLSKGDLALAKICASWPDARAQMKQLLDGWKAHRYDFSLDWLLRSVNTVLTGEAKFLHLHDKPAAEVSDALKRAGKHIDTSLNYIAGRLGLDHDRVLFGRGAISVMSRYLDMRGGQLDAAERDKLLFWYAQAAMWGRFSGSVESFIDVDLEALEGPDGGLDNLIEVLRLWRGGLRVEPAHFDSWSVGARFYPILYMLTRVRGARDWGSGLELKAELLGKMSSLEVHHIFPKAQLYKANVGRAKVNALANFCFLTKGTNLEISDTRPEVYFPEIEKRHPGALASQWVPMDEDLWRIENFDRFLEARRKLLADEANRVFKELLNGDERWLAAMGPATPSVPGSSAGHVLGGVSSDEEEEAMYELNDWLDAQGLSRGQVSFELVDPDTGEQRALLDLAWPEGVQAELTERVALLLGESAELLAVANAADYRCFVSVEQFKEYVRREILGAANGSISFVEQLEAAQ